MAVPAACGDQGQDGQPTNPSNSISLPTLPAGDSGVTVTPGRNCAAPGEYVDITIVNPTDEPVEWSPWTDVTDLATAEVVLVVAYSGASQAPPGTLAPMPYFLDSGVTPGEVPVPDALGNYRYHGFTHDTAFDIDVTDHCG
ncbi:MAG TPA: hypothetical protein VNQ73_03490 [Ilumatobacter sp.]|nr:hypothetical protein [Ilumatobacter sp.]